MDHTSTFEAYMLFRMSESEHVAKNYTEADIRVSKRYHEKGWVFQSSNPEFEEFTLSAYDASLKTNSGAW